MADIYLLRILYRFIPISKIPENLRLRDACQVGTRIAFFAPFWAFFAPFWEIPECPPVLSFWTGQVLIVRRSYNIFTRNKRDEN